MSNEQNKYGLSRYIDESIKRQIRKTCGFGCVICGLAIISYEHIDPEFHEARIHDPEKMALLCEACHSRITRKFWSKHKVKAAKENPKCIQDGKCQDAFDVAENKLILWIGTVKITNMETIFKVDDKTLLAIEPPEELNGPYRLSGEFYNESGDFLFSIVRNEWFGKSTNWDIECKGGRIIIRTSPGNISLQILCNPPTGIIIEKMNMFYENTQFTIDKNYSLRTVNKQSGSTIVVGCRTMEAYSKGCNALTSYIKNIPQDKEPYLSLGGGGHFSMAHIEFEGLPKTIQEKIINRWNTVKKNEPCPCGYGKKFKKCHGKFNSAK